MRTVHMAINESLIRAVDKLAKQLRITRTEFTRRALREALSRHSTGQNERKHQEGYERHPVPASEFSVWESEQAWGNSGW